MIIPNDQDIKAPMIFPYMHIRVEITQLDMLRAAMGSGPYWLAVQHGLIAGEPFLAREDPATLKLIYTQTILRLKEPHQ